MALRVVASRALRRFAQPSCESKRFLGDTTNKAIEHLRLEMVEHECALNRQLKDVRQKVSSKFGLTKETFNGYKSVTRCEIAKAGIEWTRYQFGALFLFTLIFLCKEMDNPKDSSSDTKTKDSCAY